MLLYVGPLILKAYELRRAAFHLNHCHKGKTNFNISIRSFIYSLAENNLPVKWKSFFSNGSLGNISLSAEFQKGRYN